MKPLNEMNTTPIRTDPGISARLRRLNLLLAIVDLAIGGFALAVSVQQVDTRLVWLAALGFVFFLITILIDRQWGIRDQNARIYLPVSGFQIVLVVFAIMFQDAGLPVAGIVLVSALVFASAIHKGDRAETSITLSLVVAGIAALLDGYPPIPQVTVPHLAPVMIGALVALTLISIWLIFRGRIALSIRIKVIVAAISVVIFPLMLLNIIESRNLRIVLQDQTDQALMASATLMANRIDDFIKTNKASISEEADLPIFGVYMQMFPDARAGTQQEAQVAAAFESFRAAMKIKERAYFVSYALLDKLGKVIFTTDPLEKGGLERNTDYFLEPTRTGRPYSSSINFAKDGKSYIYFSQVVTNSRQEVMGVLRIKFDGEILQSYALEYISNNPNEPYPVLLDENYLRLAEPKHANLLYTILVPLEQSLEIKLSFAGRLPQAEKQSPTNQYDLAGKIDSIDLQPYFQADVDNDSRMDSVAAVRLASNSWVVLFLQDRAYILGVLEDQNRRSVLIATLIAASISILATFLSRAFSRPLTLLTETAHQITSGDLQAKATVRSSDELGVLATAFNSMTARLQEMVSGLEDRVRERTDALAHQNDALAFRARQLETIADVARGAARAQELEALLKNVTALISERFGFYHVGIFLIDAQREYALLRAANSEGGQRMLARQHRLRVGQIGIVGYVTDRGEARIATDVGQDAVFFNNPDLPATRSEMALPLRLGERIIGALDVQSTESNAFRAEDIQLFGILADQIAIAIYNNQLYADTVQALAEAQNTHRRYLRQEWEHELANQPHAAYTYSSAGITPTAEFEDEAVETAIEAGEPVISHGEDGSLHVTVPVRLRGETVGLIQIKEDTPREWGQDEIQTVTAVADQVGLALENARLFNQTMRRAERERKVLEITGRIRSTNDPGQMLQIAVEELQRALKASRAQVVLQPAGAGQPADGGIL